MGNNSELLEARFVSRILREEGQEMKNAQRIAMNVAGVRGHALYNKRAVRTTENKMEFTHLMRHRFIDMSSRKTQRGRIKKISHPIHNRILFGRSISMIRRISYEYTDEMRDMITAEIRGEQATNTL